VKTIGPSSKKGDQPLRNDVRRPRFREQLGQDGSQANDHGEPPHGVRDSIGKALRDDLRIHACRESEEHRSSRQSDDAITFEFRDGHDQPHDGQERDQEQDVWRQSRGGNHGEKEE
jgi:hypothetical protein